MLKIDMLLEAFNLKPNNETWDESRKLAELQQLILNKTTKAQQFFTPVSIETKMRRDKKNTKDCSVIKIINNGKQEFYLMSGHGQSLGEGSSGRAKLAIRISPSDPTFTLYAIKREWTNLQRQQDETITLQDLKVMVGNKMHRDSTTTKGPTKNKFYTVMPYLGEGLTQVVINNKLGEKEKLNLGIQIALQLHNLHTQSRYAHLDLKPDNITVDTSKPGVYKINFIDFGFSKKLDIPLELSASGTRGYFPGTKCYLYGEKKERGKMDPRVKEYVENNYWQIGHIGLDVFALKRTLTQENIYPGIALIEVASLETVNGYDLGLMSETKRVPRKIYLDTTTEGLQYEVIGLDGALKQNTIPWDKLPEDFPRNPSDIVHSQVGLTLILLDYTSKAGHTPVNRVLYEMLSTKDDLTALQRKDTAAMIAANLILHSLQLYPACILSDENSQKIIALYEKQKPVLKEQLAAFKKELEALYPTNIAAAMQILATNLDVTPGSFILDDDLAQKILSLNTSTQDTNLLKNKLQQLFFFTQDLGINIPVERLSNIAINFPNDYPHTPCSNIQKRDICLYFITDMITIFNIDHNCMNVDKCINMMHILYTEPDEVIKNIKLLAIYLKIQIDEDILNSLHKCQNILNIFKNLHNISFIDQKDIIQKAFILSKAGMISEFDIDGVIVQDIYSDIEVVIRTFSFNHNYIDAKKNIDMMYTLCTEKDISKKNIKLLLIYLEIPIDDDALQSPHKCQNILRFLDNPDWKQLDFLKQQELMKKYIIFSEVTIVNQFNFVKFTNIENKELENCLQYLQPPHTDLFPEDQLDVLKIKVNKMLTIQMTFSLFFKTNDFPVNAAGLYNMPELQLDVILKSCTQLLAMVNKSTLRVNNNIPEKQVSALTSEIVAQVKNTDKYIAVCDVAYDYNIQLSGENITPKSLETMYELLLQLPQPRKENPFHTCDFESESESESGSGSGSDDTKIVIPTTENGHDQKNLLLFKAILAYLDLDNVFDDVNIINISSMMNNFYRQCYLYDRDVSYRNLRTQIAIQTITDIARNNYPQFNTIINKRSFNMVCMIVCNYYQAQPRENRPNFNDVLEVALNAFKDFETGEKKSYTLQTFLTAALDASKTTTHQFYQKS